LIDRNRRGAAIFYTTRWQRDRIRERLDHLIVVVCEVEKNGLAHSRRLDRKVIREDTAGVGSEGRDARMGPHI
jgi:hypothetical protein